MEVDSLLLGPGERAEVIVDLEPGKDVQLRSVPRKDNFGVPKDDNAADFGFRDSFDLLSIAGPDESAPEPPALPATLDPAAAKTPSPEGLTEREFVLNTFMINGEQMDMTRVDTVIDHAAPEIWTVTNENSDWPHNFHIHNARFQVLDWDGEEKMKVFNSGWKDIVNLPPKVTARLLVEFGHFPDKTIPYMYHCHMLLHEDQGMMGQYVIVDKGEKPDVRVKPGALVFDKDAGDHAGHANQVVDSSRSPYASPEGGV